ncbi:MAG: VWA domain-containing protein [Verrucomicrobiota bacterium]
MNWGEPLWLFALPLIGFFLIWTLIRSQVVTRRSIGTELKTVSVDHGGVRFLKGQKRRHSKMVFFWIGVAFISVALARPQWGWIEQPRFEQAREVIISLDLSKSMLAQDVSPSRLDRARLLVENLLGHLRGERVGLVLFAGTAFTQSPLSADYEVLLEFLPELNPQYLPQGGTNYAAMLDTVLEAFGKNEERVADRYLIILSDGESLSDEWQSRLDALKELSVKVVALGVGTPAGAVIPDPAGGFVKDKGGAVVLSKLNSSTLQALARKTGGVYQQADAWINLPQLLKQTVEAGKKGEFSEQSDRKPIERYQIPMLIGLLLLAISLWREFPVRPRIKNLQSSDSAEKVAPPPLPVGVFIVLIGLSAFLGSVAPVMASGEEELRAIVGTLSAQSSLDAGDYKRMAEATLQVGKQMLEKKTSLARGAIEDALEAVHEGQALNTTAADWERLRRELEKLLESSPPEDEQQQPDQNQDQQQNNQDQQQQQQGGGGSKDQNDSQNQQGNNSDSSEQESSDESKGSNDSQNQKNSGEQEKKEGENQESKSSGQNEQSQQNSSSQGAESQKNENNQLGQLANHDESQKGNEKEKPKPSKKPEKMKTIAGSKSGGKKVESGDPRMNATLQRLEQISQEDIPAELFQALNPQDPQPNSQGKDW